MCRSRWWSSCSCSCPGAAAASSALLRVSCSAPGGADSRGCCSGIRRRRRSYRRLGLPRSSARAARLGLQASSRLARYPPLGDPRAPVENLIKASSSKPPPMPVFSGLASRPRAKKTFYPASIGCRSLKMCASPISSLLNTTSVASGRPHARRGATAAGAAQPIRVSSERRFRVELVGVLPDARSRAGSRVSQAVRRGPGALGTSEASSRAAAAAAPNDRIGVNECRSVIWAG